MTNSRGNLEDFSARLRQARDRAGLTQAELAEKAGIPAATVSHFESGNRRPSFANLKRIADALGITIDFLLSRQAAPEAAGAEAQQVFRNYSALEERDKEIISQLIKAMQKNRKE